VSWDAASLSTGGIVQGYTVKRSDGVAVCGSPTLVTAQSCMDATPTPGSTYTYTVTAVYKSFTASATSGLITIADPADGSGVLSTSTSVVQAGSSGNTVSFTYTAATGGVSGGEVDVVVPSGWSAPSTGATAAGYTTASSGTVVVSGQTIKVTGVTLA